MAIKKNTNSTPNKSQTQRAGPWEVASFLSTDCELSTNPCSRFLCSLGPWLTTNDRASAIIALISFRIMHDNSSWPELVFVDKLFITLIISFGLVF